MLGIDEGGRLCACECSLVPAPSPCLLRGNPAFDHSPALKPTLALCYPWTKSKLFTSNRTLKNLKKLAPAYLSFLLSWTLLPQDPYLVAATNHCCSPGHWMPWCRLTSWTTCPSKCPGNSAWGPFYCQQSPSCLPHF